MLVPVESGLNSLPLNTDVHFRYVKAMISVVIGEEYHAMSTAPKAIGDDDSASSSVAGGLVVLSDLPNHDRGPRGVVRRCWRRSAYIEVRRLVNFLAMPNIL